MPVSNNQKEIYVKIPLTPFRMPHQEQYLHYCREAFSKKTLCTTRFSFCVLRYSVARLSRLCRLHIDRGYQKRQFRGNVFDRHYPPCCWGSKQKIPYHNQRKSSRTDSKSSLSGFFTWLNNKLERLVLVSLFGNWLFSHYQIRRCVQRWYCLFLFCGGRRGGEGGREAGTVIGSYVLSTRDWIFRLVDLWVIK